MDTSISPVIDSLHFLPFFLNVVITMSYSFDFTCYICISYFTANGRAPIEPYFGRLIGPFVEFAHHIKVCDSLYNVKIRQNLYKISIV